MRETLIFLAVALALLADAFSAQAAGQTYQTRWMIGEPLEIGKQKAEFDAEADAVKSPRGFVIAKSRVLPSGAAILKADLLSKRGKLIAATGDEFVLLESDQAAIFCSVKHVRNKFQCLVDENRDRIFEGRFDLVGSARLPLFKRSRRRDPKPVSPTPYEVISAVDMETKFYALLRYGDYSRLTGSGSFSLWFGTDDNLVWVAPNTIVNVSPKPSTHSILGATFTVWRPEPRDKKKLFFKVHSQFSKIPFAVK